MPRKTNKTAHVLNLLSVGAGGDEPTESMEKSDLPANIKIIESPEDPLADLIKDTLEKEILGSESGEPSHASGEASFAESEVSPASTPDSIVEPEPEPVPEPAPTPEPEPVPEPAPTPAPIPSPVPAPAAPPTPEVIPEPEVDYRYVNVMNHLVDDKLTDYMRKFDTCTCPRCQQDIKALALSNLPPKYMVMPKTSFAPMMSFYANKYQFNLVTELTKSCLEIINHPRH